MPLRFLNFEGRGYFHTAIFMSPGVQYTKAEKHKRIYRTRNKELHRKFAMPKCKQGRHTTKCKKPEFSSQILAVGDEALRGAYGLSRFHSPRTHASGLCKRWPLCGRGRRDLPRLAPLQQLLAAVQHAVRTLPGTSERSPSNAVTT